MGAGSCRTRPAGTGTVAGVTTEDPCHDLTDASATPLAPGAPVRDDPKAVLSSAFSAAAHCYDEVIKFFEPFGRALVAAADIAPGERVLDVACGRGAALRPALAAVGAEGTVRGIDLAQGMVDWVANDLSYDEITNATVVQGDAEALDISDGEFDAALAGFMIFFAPEPERVLAEMHRVVRPGGRVALSIFDGPPSFAWLPEVVTELLGKQPAHAGQEFNKAAVLEPALVAAGFDQPTGHDVTERFVFAAADDFEAWQRSHAGRLLLDRLDGVQLARYRGLIAERLVDHRVDGGYELVQRARMVVAHRP